MVWGQGHAWVRVRETRVGGLGKSGVLVWWVGERGLRHETLVLGEAGGQKLWQCVK